MYIYIYIYIYIGNAFHSTEERWKIDLDKLMKSLPNHVFEMIEYPEDVSGHNLSELWMNVVKPSSFEVINIIKDYLRDCHRNVLWKSMMSEELENLAKTEVK